MSLYDRTVEFVDKAFKGKKPHFERTVYWFEKFSPVFSEAHKIAAYAHDIERGIKGERDKDYLSPDFLKQHQEDGAVIIAEFLKQEGADETTIEKVKHLIRAHEVGGDAEQDALMDADSVSYFETNAEMFVTKKAPIEGYEKIKGKFDWMFNRIKSEMAREAARPNYQKWSAALKEYFNK